MIDFNYLTDDDRNFKFLPPTVITIFGVASLKNVAQVNKHPDAS